LPAVGVGRGIWRDGNGAQLPKIFHVNWFRKDAQGRFLWPGYGENLRVLEWMIDRIEGRAVGRESPVGTVPADGELRTDGLDLPAGTLDMLLDIDRAGWQAELAAIGDYLQSFGARLPPRLRAEQQRVAQALEDTPARTRHAIAS